MDANDFAKFDNAFNKVTVQLILDCSGSAILLLLNLFHYVFPSSLYLSTQIVSVIQILEFD